MVLIRLFLAGRNGREAVEAKGHKTQAVVFEAIFEYCELFKMELIKTAGENLLLY